MDVVDAAAKPGPPVCQAEEDFAVIRELGAVVPGLRGINLRVMPLRPMDRLFLLDDLVLGTQVKDALTGVTKNDVFTGEDVVVGLRPQNDLAAHAFLIVDLGDATATKFRNAFVLAEQIFADAAAELIAFTSGRGQQLLVFGRALPGLLFLFLDLGRLSLQFDLRSLDFLISRVSV